MSALEGKASDVRIQHDLAGSTAHVKRIPAGAVLQDVAASETTAFMFVMTPKHPRFDEGFIGAIPPQNC